MIDLGILIRSYSDGGLRHFTAVIFDKDSMLYLHLIPLVHFLQIFLLLY